MVNYNRNVTAEWFTFKVTAEWLTVNAIEWLKRSMVNLIEWLTVYVIEWLTVNVTAEWLTRTVNVIVNG